MMETTLEKQLQIFLDAGFELNPGVTQNDLLTWAGGTEAFAEEPFGLLYKILGLPIQREPYTPVCNQCWTFDMEFIKQTGDYRYILAQLSRISNQELEFEDVNDYIDLEQQTALVSFHFRGEFYQWQLKTDDEWADGELFERVQSLCELHCEDRRLTYFDPGGSVIVLGFAAENTVRQIRKKSGLDLAIIESFPL
ncbi:MAG: hypothetical protein NVV59_18245 [Chitinophagaceae bacterium]|nr:hypothetical protein [Chitinophagaceae bacterium]